MNLNEYKAQVRTHGKDANQLMDEIEQSVQIINIIIHQRQKLGLSQRDLASLCHMSQSTIARIESFSTTPNLETLLKMMNKLGLQIQIATMNNDIK